MNKELKEILDFKEDADYKRLSVDEITILRYYITNLQEENDKLQERIDKAIEHLKEVMKDEEEYEEDYIYNKYLLDILQGSDKE